MVQLAFACILATGTAPMTRQRASKRSPLVHRARRESCPLKHFASTASPVCGACRSQCTRSTCKKPSRLTNNEARKKGIDPAHNQRLRNHHGHLALHHAHHALHGRRIAHGIRPRFPPHVRLSQELSFLERLHHVCFARGKRRGRDDVGVCAQVDAADERALLADLQQVLFLGRGLQQRHGVVAEDAREDLWAL